jgi:NAD(P)-dependent dehydrogenase (short-subunit alcohol dehydrogenase family)
MDFEKLFRLDDQIALVTGGGGALCSAMAKGLAQAGATVVLLGRTLATVEAVAADINEAGGQGLALSADVTVQADLKRVRQTVLEKYGRLDILVNGAGGNHPSATTSAELSIFDLPQTGIDHVFGVNFLGTLLPCQVFGKIMADQDSGVIINISSMAAFKPMTRVPIYAAAKTAINNFTFWLSTHMAQEYSTNIRVNAIAPGFFVGDQNRRLLLDEDESLTSRGQSIIDHTPMNRFGDPDDLAGTTVWLASPASKFVTGIIVPVDGGFSAFGGV